MSIKDGLQEIKEELSNDEKLLEQAFHLEKFFKKHKTKIIATVSVIIIAVAGYSINNYIKEQRLLSANKALLILEKDPTNKEALEELKSNNEKLYKLFLYSYAVDKENPKLLEELQSNDELLSDIISYHKAVLNKKTTDSKYYKNLALVEKAYLLIKEGKKEQAKTVLMQVPKNSAVAPVARLLAHYTIK
jgi:hypothetical protein